MAFWYTNNLLKNLELVAIPITVEKKEIKIKRLVYPRVLSRSTMKGDLTTKELKKVLSTETSQYDGILIKVK